MKTIFESETIKLTFDESNGTIMLYVTGTEQTASSEITWHEANMIVEAIRSVIPK